MLFLCYLWKCLESRMNNESLSQIEFLTMFYQNIPLEPWKCTNKCKQHSNSKGKIKGIWNYIAFLIK
jgi:hypothetical protein